LLKVKTRASYSHTPASPDEAKKAARVATQLVEEALAAATPGPCSESRVECASALVGLHLYKGSISGLMHGRRS